MSMQETRDTMVVKVKDLQPGDKIVYDTLLGSMKTADDLTVKSIDQADMGRYALTLYRVGTLFVPGDQTVEILDTDD
jgi:hypothetical protein